MEGATAVKRPPGAAPSSGREDPDVEDGHPIQFPHLNSPRCGPPQSRSAGKDFTDCGIRASRGGYLTPITPGEGRLSGRACPQVRL